jgi:hypothetical protein
VTNASLAVTVSGSTSVADINTINADTATGVVTATLTTGALADFSTLNTSSNDVITVNIDDASGSSLSVSALATLGGKTAGVVTVSNAVSLTGTAAQLIAALYTPDTKVVSATANVTFTDAPSLVQLAQIDAVTAGTLTYTSIADTAANLYADALLGSSAVAYNKPITVTDTGTVSASQLVAISGNTNQTLDVSAAANISGSAANLISIVDDTGITTSTSYNALITDDTVTAGQIFRVDPDTTGSVSVNSISDSLVNIASLNVSSASIIQNASGTVTATGTDNADSADFSTVAHSMVITGNAGNDNLTGTNYADTINGGTGADSLLGKGGADVFSFAPGDSPTVLVGQLIFDKIGDFTPSADKIDLSVSPFFGASESRAVTLSGLSGGVSIDATGKVTFTVNGVDGAGDATLSELLAAVRSVVGDGELAYFEFNDGYNFVGTSTFLYQDNGPSVNDILIMLSGVSGISSISSTAGGANTLFIA